VNHAYMPPVSTMHVSRATVSTGVSEGHFQRCISGHMPTTFDPQCIKRYPPARGSVLLARPISKAAPSERRTILSRHEMLFPELKIGHEPTK
jgi:hypothetical protein